jgi:hypothetical protein
MEVNGRVFRNLAKRTFVFRKQIYFVVSSLRIIGHGNPDNNLESHCKLLARVIKYCNI